MKKFKSIMCLLLAMIMLLSLAACGGKGNTDSTKPDSGSQGSNQGGSADQGGNEGENPDRPAETVYLKWMACDCGNIGRDEVDAEVKRYVKEKLNVELDIFWYPAADIAGVMSTEMTVGDWDISCVQASSFKNFAPRNLFLDLKPYLEQGYLPTAQELLWQEAFDSATIDGKVLGVPAYKDLAENWGMILNKTMLDEYGLEIPENWGTLMDFLPTMYEWTEAYREANPGDQDTQVVDISQWLPAWFKYESFIGEFNTTLACANVPGYDSFAGYDYDEVFCPYFTDEYMEYVKTLYQLVQDGIATGKKGSQQGMNCFNTVTLGYLEIDPWLYEDWECAWAAAGTPVLNTTYYQQALYVVKKDCENPERALQFMEMLYSDEYLCTVLKFGIEGKDWSDEDNDGIIERLGRNSDPDAPYWYDWYGARNSSVIGGKLSDAVSEEFLVMLDDLNNNSPMAANCGFIFDQTPILNEIAACTNAMARYTQTIAEPVNITNPEKLVNDFRSALVANGIETILEEVQRQLDEWRAANGKN